MSFNYLKFRKFTMELVVLAFLTSGAINGTNNGIFAKTETKSKTESKKQSEDEKKSSSKSSESSDNDKSDSDNSSSSNDRDEEEKADDSKEESSKETPTPLTPENLPQKLSSILSSVSKSSDWGVKVTVAETGQSLFDYQSDQGFIPASNRKLFTGALALDQLGPDFVFRTYLYYTGNIDANGTLNGNLVIIPSGDPTFSTTLYKSAQPDWVFRDWADKVKAAGIRNVTGDMLIDCSTWDLNDLNPKGWATRVLNDSYAPQTSPLTINENLCNIVVTPTKAGQPAAISFIPAATGYPVLNKTESGKKGTAVVKRIVNSHMEVSGGISSKQTVWSRPIDRPTLFAAANFRDHLMKNEVPIQGQIRIISTPRAIPAREIKNTLAMVESPKLIDIIDYMMKRSDNHMAEQIYVAVSAAKLGKGSYSNSYRLEADLLQRAQIDSQSLHVYDGSGLSESNRVSPTQVCKLLTYMRSHPFAQQYYNSMAISGRDGTLRNRMSRISGRVHAKTGTINGVKALSGYLTLSPTQTLSFSFLVNHIKGGSVSSIQDRLCSTLAALIL